MREAHELVQTAWGKRVKAARKSLGLTQTEAAASIGIGQATLSRIETGNYTAADPEMLLKICVGLRRDPEELFPWPPAIREIAEMRSAA